MKSKVLWIFTSIFLGIAMNSCAPKRDMFSYSNFRAATAPATETTATVKPVVVEIIEPREDANVAVEEDIIFITDEDIEKFEKELRSIMGGDLTATTQPTRTTRPARPARPASTTVNNNVVNARFYVITGSFSSLENAQTHKKELEADGNQSGILNEDAGMFRVYAFAGNNRAQALKELQIIRDFFPNAWLFVKR